MRRMTTSDKRRYIRMAAMEFWSSGDYNGFYEDMEMDGWSGGEVQEFLIGHESQIDRAYNQLNRWLDGEDRIH